MFPVPILHKAFNFLNSGKMIANGTPRERGRLGLRLNRNP